MRVHLPAFLLAVSILSLALPSSPSAAAALTPPAHSGATGATGGAGATAAAGETGATAASSAPIASPTTTRQDPWPQSGSSGQGRGVPYEKQGPSLGGLLLRSAGALALMTVLAFAAAIVAKRYMPGLKGFSASGTSRVQLLESKRITPRLTLFVVEFEGRRLLLAQSGDRIVEVGAPARDAQSAGA